MEQYLDGLRNYATFTGRATRKQFWMFVLVSVIISVVLNILQAVLGSWVGVLSLIYGLAVLVPSIAISVRRLHDTDRSGWWLLIALVPFVGAIVLIVFYCMEGTAGANQYGMDGRGASAASMPAPMPAAAPAAPASDMGMNQPM
jgi:uncharacterized membrane protein YhaH (DUF805 family)